MLTYNTIIQDTLTEINDSQKSQDIILTYGAQHKKIDNVDILINQKELLSFPLWNVNSEFIPTQSTKPVDLTTGVQNISLWQFKFVYSDEATTSPYFGLYPREKKYFLSQSLGYVLNAKTADFDEAHQNVLFYFGYADYDGSGSVTNSITGNAPSEILNSSPSKILYRAVRNQILETDEKLKLADFTEMSDFFYIKIPRNIYREKIQKKSLSLMLSNSSVKLQLTDDTKVNSSVIDNSPIVSIVSGTLNTYFTSSENVNSSLYTNKIHYGILDTDNGYILLNTKRIFDYFTAQGAPFPYGTGSNDVFTLPITHSSDSRPTQGTELKIYKNLSSFAQLLYNGAISSSFKLNGIESYTYDTYYLSVGAYDFNRSTNPTYLTGSKNDSFKKEIVSEDFVYITSIGLYNDNGDLLAVGKLSRPVLKKRGDVKLFKVNISL